MGTSIVKWLSKYVLWIPNNWAPACWGGHEKLLKMCHRFCLSLVRKGWTQCSGFWYRSHKCLSIWPLNLLPLSSFSNGFYCVVFIHWRDVVPSLVAVLTAVPRSTFASVWFHKMPVWVSLNARENWLGSVVGVLLQMWYFSSLENYQGRGDDSAGKFNYF